MKKWTVYLIGLLIFMFVSIGNASSIYTVQSGDTLAGIATKLYGDYRKWEDIWRLNPQIKDKDLIFPGQVLVLTAKIKPQKLITVSEVKERLVKHMFKVNYWEYKSRRELVNEFEENTSKIHLNGSFYLHNSRIIFSELTEITRQLEVYHLIDGIMEACKYEKDYKMVVLLTALAWQETHFKNVVGKHGEITPFQFLPSTLKEILKLNNDKELFEVMEKLKNDLPAAAGLAYEWLKDNGCGKGNFKQALSWWNHHPTYPNTVMWRYNKIMKMIKEDI